MTNLYNIDVEAGYLGLALNNTKCFTETVTSLEPHDFYDPIYSRAYEQMQKLYINGKTVDIRTILTSFKDEKERGKIMQAATDVYSTSLEQTEDYAEQILSLSKKRQLRNVLGLYLEQIEDSDLPFEDIMTKAESAMLDISIGKDVDSCLNKGRSEALVAIEHSMKHGGIKGIQTGFKSLDGLLGGLADTNLVIIGGDTGMGKTSFALSLTMNNIKSGKSGLFASLEVSRIELHQKILSMATGIKTMPMATGQIDQVQFKELYDVEDTPNLHILSDAGLDIDSLTIAARRLKAKKELDFIVVDYVQLMQAPSSIEGQGSNAKTSFITRELKKLAMLLDVPVIALSQLRKNRGVPNTTDIVKPTIPDLLGSGSIANDANIIILVHRDEYYLERNPLEEKPVHMKGEAWNELKLARDEHEQRAKGKAQIIVGKSRMGGIGECEVQFINHTTEFKDND